MRPNFNSEYLNDLKAVLDEGHRTVQYFDRLSLSNFVNELAPEEKEKIFMIHSQGITEEIQALLTQVFSMPRRNKLEKSRVHYYAVSKRTDEDSALKNDADTQAISICELSNLPLFYNQPHFREFIESVAMLNQRNYQQEIMECDQISEEDLKRYILDKDYLGKKKPVVKIIAEVLDGAFGLLQEIIGDFGQGYKVVVEKKHEEKLFYSVSKNIMYQLNSTGRFVRQSLEAYSNKLYSNFIALAVVFENRLLRKFSKQNPSLSFEGTISTYLKNSVDALQGIHIKALSFTLNDYEDEEAEYKDDEALKAKNQRMTESDQTVHSTNYGSDEDYETDDSIYSSNSNYPYNKSYHGQGNFSFTETANNLYPQQAYSATFYPQQGYLPSFAQQRGSYFYNYPEYQSANYYYQSDPLGESQRHFNRNNGNRNNHKYNYNNFNRHCGLKDEFTRTKNYNTKHYQYVKME